MNRWQHEHVFGQDRKTVGEHRTQIVIVLTGITMLVEISAGLIFGSMALLADGVHMASHTAALGISVLAYSYTRRHARDSRFSFGSGKINALAGFASAILLGVFALWMAIESAQRIWNPVAIAFDAAIAVAIVGFAVNGLSLLLLGRAHHEHHEHDSRTIVKHQDHNLRSAYLHVLADTLTSVFAIVALAGGKYFGWIWLDPVMGIVGSILITRWAYGLVKEASHVLLSYQATSEHIEAVRYSIESVDTNKIADIHMWSVGPGIYALIVVIVTHHPKPASDYHALLPTGLGIAHATIEVHQCDERDGRHLNSAITDGYDQ